MMHNYSSAAYAAEKGDTVVSPSNFQFVST